MELLLNNVNMELLNYENMDIQIYGNTEKLPTEEV